MLGELGARRGRISGSASGSGTALVTAVVPLAGLFGYAPRLRGRTQGCGTFTTGPWSERRFRLRSPPRRRPANRRAPAPLRGTGAERGRGPASVAGSRARGAGRGRP
ncbi:hypothetical protein [Streptomyces cirratus]|uniref:hypothetical protein n=1 Tax=Streptomyces cirratus TaxID=68187 RepID=UPI0027E3C658|nr:hypothetical protein [Streptomyces cirratus]